MIPRATYRLQFHKDFAFADAASLVDYFDALGISHIYASPILKGRPGSLHGYDVVDHAEINPELGGETAFRDLVEVLRGHGMGVIVDVVPNHMAVGPGNAWWLDVIEKGRASPYAEYFDIDWNAPGLEGKLLLPVLGASLEQAIEHGELTAIQEAATGKVSFAYYAQRFPLRPEDQTRLQGCDLSALSRDDLVHLHKVQHFALSHWREAGSHINWRRFFDVNELAALQIERDDVFDAVHAKLFALYAEGLIDGVRVDHIDGLADPRAYCRRLRARLQRLDHEHKRARNAYIIVEKILAEGEDISADWAIDGTTGYDFMNDVAALLHSQTGEQCLNDLWHEISGRSPHFEDEEFLARIELLDTSFVAQARAAARALGRAGAALGEIHCSRDCEAALRTVLTRLRCYRSYATGRGDTPSIGPFFASAVGRAWVEEPVPAIDMIEKVMSDTEDRPMAVDAIRRVNQLSSTLAAKSVEDRGFYRYGRLLSRNDVGFDPRRMALSPAEFHSRQAWRAAKFPHELLTTATHDHKRGEDGRARLAVLSELPEWWAETARGWLRDYPGPAALDAADLYQLFQTLLGCWPYDGADEPAKASLSERLQNWCVKFLREGGLRSSWHSPDESYEGQFCAYVRDLLAAPAFVANLERAVATIAAPAIANSIVQASLRCLLPGITDLYQGCELWDLSLVDPDNRRPVNYYLRQCNLTTETALRGEAPAWLDGSAKQTLLRRLLRLRRVYDAVFEAGEYEPIEATGVRAGHIVAFARGSKDAKLVAVAAIRMARELQGGTALAPPEEWWGDTDLQFANGARIKMRDLVCAPEATSRFGLSLHIGGRGLPIFVFAPGEL